MSARKTLIVWCAGALLALGLAACGTTATSTGNFKGEQHAVAQRIADLQSHATALEQKKICHEDLASAIVARLNASGGCAKAIETQLKEIDNFETTVESVAVSGDTATARVKSVNAGKKAVQTLKLVKEGKQWKIASVS